MGIFTLVVIILRDRVLPSSMEVSRLGHRISHSDAEPLSHDILSDILRVFRTPNES